MTVTEGVLDESLTDLRLPVNARKARYGIAYVSAVFSQAGVPFTETSPDEDHLAVDGVLNLGTAPICIQVKCSGQFRIRGRSASWSVEPEWREKWTKSKLPVYFILVILDIDDHPHWLLHKVDGTMHKAAAFWVRVDKLGKEKRIKIPKRQRLTVDTLSSWSAEVDACFEPLAPAAA
ncbi:DUF4365 domain-containing protein [Asanoa iriomotensis]|uniref:DUF4365 domain-containing protein n=1 Tax=Asanoa iriomotensis TaxID=234613 RepID=A0ABQ4CFT8_9ACTN|nr:DUF4365 domain-containing protein [Asanoa iriomotensis]GIF61648.1 hypothetical protein Air01nite_77430 [Asanoa iriomotensis]